MKVKFHDLVSHFHFMTSYHALATATASLIKLLFRKFIVYIMNNLRAQLGCHISNNNSDKEGVESAPPPFGIECFKMPRSDRVKRKDLGFWKVLKLSSDA